MWEIEILFLIEEPSKMFAYFLYHFHIIFHLKTLEISFSNSQLFPHTDDLILQEVLPKLAEHRPGARVGGQVKLHLPIMGAAVAAHHAVEVLASANGLSHVLRRWLNVVVRCVGVSRRVSISYDSPCPISILLFGSTPTISSFLFTFIFFHPHNFNFFIQIKIFENKRISIEIFEILRILNSLIQTHSRSNAMKWNT